MHRPIVVAVDGSESSLRAAEWAASEAIRRTAPLRIVAAPERLPRLRAYDGTVSAVGNALRGLAARALAAAVERIAEAAPGLPVDTSLLTGPPALSVTDNAADGQLLVVGACGAGRHAALGLGSVSGYLVTHATCPVVVVGDQTVTEFNPALATRDHQVGLLAAT